VLALNEVRGVGSPGWLGLREFGQDRYPEIWPSLSTYFPDGLRNSRGEVVTDLIKECASRALHGSLHRARWVECDIEQLVTEIRGLPWEAKVEPGCIRRERRFQSSGDCGLV